MTTSDSVVQWTLNEEGGGNGVEGREGSAASTSLTQSGQHGSEVNLRKCTDERTRDELVNKHEAETDTADSSGYILSTCPALVYLVLLLV